MPDDWSLVSRTGLLLMLLAASGQTASAQTGRQWVDPPAGPSTPAQAAPQPAEPSPQAPAPRDAAPPAQTAAPPAATPTAPSAPPATQSAEPSKPAAPPETAPRRESAQPAHPPVPPPPAPTVSAAPPRDSLEGAHASRIEAAKAFAVDYLNSWSAPNDEALGATAEFYAPRVLFHGRTVSMRSLFNEKQRFARRWPERDYRPRRDSIGVACNPTGDVCTVHTVFDYVAENPARHRHSEGTGALQLIVNFIGEKPVIVAEHSTLLGQERRRSLRLGGASDE